VDAGLNELARRLVTLGFIALWEGRAARAEELITSEAGRARQVLAELVERGRAEIDGHGRVVGIHGLTLGRTRHHFVHRGRVRQTWCAFDSIGIPAALAIDAEASTTCPACDRGLRIVIRGGEPEVSGVALWLPVPPVRHLMAEFCAAADLYCGREHLEERIDTAVGLGKVLDLPAAAALGREGWADVAGLG
jgi:alkylmercury lyase